jgi:hypothetical protein
MQQKQERLHKTRWNTEECVHRCSRYCTLALEKDDSPYNNKPSFAPTSNEGLAGGPYPVANAARRSVCRYMEFREVVENASDCLERH